MIEGSLHVASDSEPCGALLGDCVGYTKASIGVDEDLGASLPKRVEIPRASAKVVLKDRTRPAPKSCKDSLHAPAITSAPRVDPDYHPSIKRRGEKHRSKSKTVRRPISPDSNDAPRQQGVRQRASGPSGDANDFSGIDVGSSTTLAQIRKVREELSLPSELELRVPLESDIPSRPPRDFAAVRIDSLRNGLGLPFQPTVQRLLNVIGLHAMQLSPACYRYLAACHAAWHDKCGRAMTLGEFRSLFSFYHNKGVPGLHSPRDRVGSTFLKGLKIQVSKRWRSNWVWTSDRMFGSTKQKFGALVSPRSSASTTQTKEFTRFFTELSKGGKAGKAGEAYLSRERWISSGWYPSRSPLSISDSAIEVSSSPSAAPSESRLLSEASGSPSSFSSLSDSSATPTGSPSHVSPSTVSSSEASLLTPTDDRAFPIHSSSDSPPPALLGAPDAMAPGDRRNKRRLSRSPGSLDGARGSDPVARPPRVKRKFSLFPDPSDARGHDAVQLPRAKGEARKFTPAFLPPVVFRDKEGAPDAAVVPVGDVPSVPSLKDDEGPERHVPDAYPAPTKRTRGPTRPTVTERALSLGDRCVADLKTIQIGDFKTMILRSGLDSIDEAAALSRRLSILNTHNADVYRTAQTHARELGEHKRELRMERNSLLDEVKRLKATLDERASELKEARLLSAKHSVEMNRSRQELLDLRTKMSSFQDEVERHSDERASIQAQLDERDRVAAFMRAKLEGRDQMVTSLRDSLALANQTITQLEKSVEEELEAMKNTWDKASDKMYWMGVLKCHRGYQEENAGLALSYKFLDVDGAPTEVRPPHPPMLVPDESASPCIPPGVAIELDGNIDEGGCPADPLEGEEKVDLGDGRDGEGDQDGDFDDLS